MYRLLTIAALVALSAAAFGQSKGQRPVPGKAENELIAMSRTYVETGIGEEIVVATDEESTRKQILQARREGAMVAPSLLACASGTNRRRPSVWPVYWNSLPARVKRFV